MLQSFPKIIENVMFHAWEGRGEDGKVGEGKGKSIATMVLQVLLKIISGE